jgi:membrane-associated protease RseP (regulator of RpoE activity)
MGTPIPVKSFAPRWPDGWANLFERYQMAALAGGRLIRGKLRPDLDPGGPEVRRVLSGWPGPSALHTGPEGAEAMLFAGERLRPRWWLHGLLFALTVASVLVAGGLLAGREPLTVAWAPLRIGADGAAWAAGVPFATVLLTILLVHEMGHYGAARRHRMEVTPPFFIPVPAYLSIVGTLGAFIRLRSPLLGRRPLLDVGVAGPLAGFVVSAAATVAGFAGSVPVAGAEGLEPAAPYAVSFLGSRIWVGGSLFLNVAEALVLGDAAASAAVVLSPIALAGWFGLFLTALNLLPLGQLDGGHILYALAPRAQPWVSWVALGTLLPLGAWWPGWWVWAALVFLVSRGRMAHPPVWGERTPLDTRRKLLAWTALAVLVLTFVPQPFVL